MHSITRIRYVLQTFPFVFLFVACGDKKSAPPTGPEPYPSGYASAPAGVVSSAAVAESGFSFQVIGDLASTGSPSISADGITVAGTRNKRAVKWTAAGGIIELGALPGGDGTSTAWAISGDGSVIVGSASSANGTEAFRWTASTGMLGLGDISGSGSFLSFAQGVSADGSVIVGMSSRRWPIARAFRWTANGGMIDLGAFPGGDGYSRAHAVTPDGTVIVGGSRNASGIEEAFRWTATTGITSIGLLPGNGFTRAQAVSSDGQVIVGMGSINIGMEGFRWTPAGGVVGLGSLDANDFASAAFAVSASGRVVTGIGSGAADFNGEAFIWFPGTGMLNLKQYLLNHGVTEVQGLKLGYGSGMSADGRTIVGGAVDATGKPATWVARVALDTTQPPAPGSDTIEEVRPASVSILSGTPVSGGAIQLQASDDNYVRWQNTGKRVLQISILGQASKAQLSELRLSVEAAVSGSVAIQEIALFDFAASTWVVMRQGAASSTDQNVIVATRDRPARFVEGGTRRVMARVSFMPSGNGKTTTTARLDRVAWTRVP